MPDAIPRTILFLSKKTTSMGNFIPIVCMPLLGISHNASSGPRVERLRSPTNRVTKLSAFLIFVASQVFFVKLITGTDLPHRICERFHDLQPRWPKQNNKNRRKYKKHQGKDEFDYCLARSFLGRLAAFVAHGFGIYS